MKAWKKWLIAVFSIVLVAGITIGTVWLVNNWDALTSDTTLYTQEDIDDAYEQGLNDAGYEVILQYQEQIAIIQGQLEESQIKVGNLTDSLNQALEQNKIDAEAIAGYLDDIAELSDDITDLNNQIKLYQELLEAYENSGKYEVVFYLVQNGEQTPYDVQVVEPNGYLSEVVEPEGNFEGWSLTIGGDLIESLTSVQITEDTNIYGTFYSTVTFMVNDEEYSTQQVGYNKYATEPEEPEVQYYTFEGWTLNGEDVVAVNTYQITQDTTFVAELTKNELSTFIEKSWNGLTDFSGRYVWTDNYNVYYSNGEEQYILNKETSTWEEKVWLGLVEFDATNIWTDGESIYYSDRRPQEQYVLDRETSTWIVKVWNGLNYFYGEDVWTDGENIYYSQSSEQYVLDRETSTWNVKVWNLKSFFGYQIWSDTINYYISDDINAQYILNQDTDTWEEKIWNGIGTSSSRFDGQYVWTDGKYIYYSDDVSHQQYILNQDTDTWEEKIWNGIPERDRLDIDRRDIWTDGENIYYSEGINHYIIV